MSKIFKITLASMFAAAVMLSAGTASAAITRDLTVGSYGADVQELQVFLNSCNDTALPVALGTAGAPGKESMNFGPATQKAVMAFQKNNGVSPVSGYVGALTRAAMAMGNKCGTTNPPVTPPVVGTYPAGCMSNVGFSSTTGASCAAVVTTLPAGCSSTAGFSSTTGASCSGTSTVNNGPLTGSAGEIADVNKLSQYSNEEVGESEKDVKVMGFEVEASNDGDIELKSVKVSAIITNASGSTRITDYTDEVNVWQGSTKVGTAMADDFTKNSTGNYSKTVALNGAVVRADKIEKFYVSFTSPSGFDSGDIDSESFTLGLDNVRFIDGSGVVTTEDTTGDLPMTTTVSFVSFSTSADTIMKVSLDNSPKATVVEVDDSDTTDDVVLLKGKIKLEGKSDVTIDTLPITLTTTGDSISALTGNVTLMLGDKEYSESTGSNCSVDCDLNTTATLTFDNLDYKISANTSSPSTGTTVNFTIKAELNDIENTGVTATDFDAGEALTASLTATNRDAMDVENSQGDQLNTSSERSGSATGEPMTFYADGIIVSDFSAVKSQTTDTNGQYTKQSYAITFKAKAFGDAYYIPKTVVEGTTALAANQGLRFVVEDSTGTTNTTTDTTISSISSTASTVSNYFEIPDGETKTFNATVSISLGTAGAGFYRLQLGAVGFDLDQTGVPSELSLTPSQDYETADGQIDA